MIDWTPVSTRLGYTDENAMWADLYDTQKLSIEALAKRLGVSRDAIRHALQRGGRKLRGRGGANRTSVAITDELLAEVKKDGVLAVAKRLQINYTTLYKRIRRSGRTIDELRKESD